MLAWAIQRTQAARGQLPTTRCASLARPCAVTIMTTLPAASWVHPPETAITLTAHVAGVTIGALGGLLAVGTVLFLALVLRFSEQGLASLAPILRSSGVAGIIGSALFGASLFTATAEPQYYPSASQWWATGLVALGSALILVGVWWQSRQVQLGMGTLVTSVGAGAIVTGMVVPLQATMYFPQALMSALSVALVLAAATWLGCTVGLWLLARQHTALELKSTMPRFAEITHPAMLTSAAVGCGVMLSQVPSWGAVWGTPWGGWLLVVAALTLVLMGLGIHTGVSVARAFADRGLRDRAADTLLVTLAVQVVLFVITVPLTAWLILYSPRIVA